MNLNLKLDEVREEVLNLLGHGMGAVGEKPDHGKNRREMLRIADVYRDHPLVNSFLSIIEDYDREMATSRARV